MEDRPSDNRLGIDEAACDLAFSDPVIVALDVAAEVSAKSGLRQSHSAHILLGLLSGNISGINFGHVVPVESLVWAINSFDFADTRLPTWDNISRRFRISSDGRLACNVAVAIAKSSGRRMAEPLDLLITTLINEDSSAAQVLGRAGIDARRRVLDAAMRVTDVRAEEIERYSQLGGSGSVEVVARENSTFWYLP